MNRSNYEQISRVSLTSKVHLLKLLKCTFSEAAESTSLWKVLCMHMWRGRCLLHHSYATPAKVISHTYFALKLALEAPTPVSSVMPCKISLSTITPSYSAECDVLTCQSLVV